MLPVETFERRQRLSTLSLPTVEIVEILGIYEEFINVDVFDYFTVSPVTDEAQTVLFKDPVRTAQEILFISVIKTNQFML